MMMMKKKKIAVSDTRELELARAKLLSMLKGKASILSRGLAATVRLVRGYLTRRRILFTEGLDTSSATRIFKGTVYTDGLINAYPWIVIAAEDVVQSLFRYPVRVQPIVHAAIAEFSACVNRGMKYGKMTIDLDDDGSVAFQVSIPSSFAAADPSLATELLLEMPEQILDHYAPGFLDVLGGASPHHAFERCSHGLEDEDAIINNNADETDGEDEDEDDGQTSDRVVDCKTACNKDMPSSEGGASRLPPLAADYSLDGLNIKGSVSLDQIVSAVRRFRETGDQGIDVPRMNILLSGPSGTGKTEFVKYLAREVNAEVVVVRVSDVIRPQVGVTEMNLASFFRRAAHSRAILFLDEVDSLLAARSRAEYTWEVTRVNELLQQMEQFGGVLVAATNFAEALDTAVQRRFTFKLCFDYLSEKGRETFFKRYFKTKLTVKERTRLRSMTCLTPGDFRTVRQNQFYLFDNPTATQRLDGLEAEMVAREKDKRPQVGF